MPRLGGRRTQERTLYLSGRGQYIDGVSAVPWAERLCEEYLVGGPERWARVLRRYGGLAWMDGEGPDAEGWTFIGCAPVQVRSAELSSADPLAAFDVGGASGSRRSEGTGRSGRPPVPEWIGFVSYDAAWTLEPSLTQRHARAPDMPVVWLGRYDALVALEHATGQAHVIADDEAAGRRLLARLAPRAGASSDAVRISEAYVAPEAVHEAAVRAALEYIAAGDVYQVNLARRWGAKYSGDGLPLFMAMRRASPVPLGAYIDMGRDPIHDLPRAVMSRTMETFLRWDRATKELSSRPIKGTIPRREGEDEIAAATLVADDKERAEHTMIVDLMRNDLSRVAAIGSVRVVDPLTVEPYAKLSHLVSTVTCTTREDVDLVDVMRATFPPGSVTGAPKIRAVQIIEELEEEPRGVYCGAIGYVDRCGGLHLAVAIRTASLAHGTVHYFAGGGLVSASDPERETAETVLKARVFLDALTSLRTSN